MILSGKISLQVDESDEEKALEKAENFLKETIQKAPSNAVEDNEIRDKPVVTNVEPVKIAEEDQEDEVEA